VHFNHPRHSAKCRKFFLFLYLCTIGSLLLVSGCANRRVEKVMEATAYCGCSSCCSWERGSWRYLKLDFWNRYVSGGPRSGQYYSGLTASMTKPREPEEGLFSLDSLARPWMVPVRIVFFPWYLLPHDGTIAADTDFYPFGTRMYVPGYGWGTVEDRGSAIQGPDRIDLYFNSHHDALVWGRRKINVIVDFP
jgi:hypothetical protein